MALHRARTSPWSRSALDEKKDTTGEREGEEKSGDIGEGERQMQVQPAPVQDGRTDVRADEGGIELWQRLLQGAGSGPGEADILLILYFFVCGPAVGTVGHASPSVHSGPASSSASLHDHTAITVHHDPTSAIVLAGIVDSTHLSRSRVFSQLQVFTFHASSASRLLLLLLLHLLLLLFPFSLLLFLFVILYNRIKWSRRLSALIVSQWCPVKL